MTIRKKVFTSQKIIVVAGKEFSVQALVSSYGAKYVFEDNDIPLEVLSRLNEEIIIRYKTISVKARAVREITAFGANYNFRFIQPSAVLIALLDKDIADSGLPSPWIRGLPRLGTQQKHLPVPSLSILYYKTQTYYLNVNNFTLGGLQLEYVGSDLFDIVYGSKLEIDLVTNTGEKIADMSALVTHVTVEINFDGYGSDRYIFGLKLMGMPVNSESKFRGLIREHCLQLKGEMEVL